MNSVSWFNIPSDNLERALTFYRDVFGWVIQPLTKEKVAANDFHTVLTGQSNDSNWPLLPGVVNGCIVKRDMGIPHATILILVEDLDQAEKRLVAAGGQVISERMHIAGVNGGIDPIWWTHSECAIWRPQCRQTKENNELAGALRKSLNQARFG